MGFLSQRFWPSTLQDCAIFQTMGLSRASSSSCLRGGLFQPAGSEALAGGLTVRACVPFSARYEHIKATTYGQEAKSYIMRQAVTKRGREISAEGCDFERHDTTNHREQQDPILLYNIVLYFIHYHKYKPQDSSTALQASESSTLLLACSAQSMVRACCSPSRAGTLL